MTTEERRAMILALAMAGSGGGGGGGGEGAVLYDTEQSLNSSQKRQARYNIDAVPRLALEAEYVAQGMMADTAAEIYNGVANGVTVVGNGQMITLDGTGTKALLLSLLGKRVQSVAATTTPSEAQLAEGPFDVIQGHTYRMRLRLVSGTITGNKPYVGLFDTTGATLFTITNNVVTSGFACIAGDEMTFTMDRAQIGQFCLFSYKDVTYTNAVLAIELQDVTAGDNGITIQVTGATPAIAAIPGGRYVCSAAYVTELEFAPSASGVCSVRFTSGSTPTVLSLPNTVVMPDWWTGCEASRTYEISIADGVYGMVTSWA